MKELDERIARARELHKEGYNCSQCVVMAFDDMHNMPLDLSARIAAGLGGGVGGQRQICGSRERYGYSGRVYVCSGSSHQTVGL